MCQSLGAIQVLCKAVGGVEGCQMTLKKVLQRWFNPIIMTRGWVGLTFPEKGLHNT